MAPPHDLLARMRRSKAGWRRRDLHRLYTGFGFEFDEAGKHMLYIHPVHVDLRATVTRSTGELPSGYIVTAVQLIGELLEREHGD
jgi:hypothetical protein